MVRKLLKLLLPASIIRSIKESGAIEKVKIWQDIASYNYLIIISSNYIFSSLHYGLLSRAFRLEHHSVAYGRFKFYDSFFKDRFNRYLLRRNVHRLEKGLLMRPRRPVFALDYIEETVQCYESIRKATNINAYNDEELLWAHDVLSQYFIVVVAHPRLARVRSKFLAQKPLSQKNDLVRVPYKRKNCDSPSVTYDDFLKLSQWRKSVRWYLPKPVPRDCIDKAILIAGLSPSACNRQPFEFRIFDDPNLVQKVAALPMGTAGFRHNFLVIVALVGKLNAFFSERDRHLIYIDSSLAAMSFMYALETLGLSSCPLNWPDVPHLEEGMSKLLNLAPDERVIMLISLGYPDPDGMVAYSQKKSLNELRRYNI